MADNAADRKSIRAREKAAAVAEAQRREIVAGIMSTPAGRAWILDLLESAHVFASSFQHDALATAFAEGERNIGLRILHTLMQSCPDQYLLMMRERNEKDIANGRSSTRERSSGPGADGGIEVVSANDGAYGPDDGTDDYGNAADNAFAN